MNLWALICWFSIHEYVYDEDYDPADIISGVHCVRCNRQAFKPNYRHPFWGLIR